MLKFDENLLYREVVMEHYKNPLHKGLDKNLPVFSSKNATCGDSVFLQIKIEDDTITQIYQNSSGCSISVSSVSILTDLILNKKRQEAIKIIENFINMIDGKNYDQSLNKTDAVVFKNIKNYPARRKCVLGAWELAYKILKNEIEGN